MQLNPLSTSSAQKVTESHTYQPHGDVRVRRAGDHLVIFAAAVQTPNFVLVGVQRLHALICLYGPQLYQTIGATEDRARSGGMVELDFSHYIDHTISHLLKIISRCSRKN